jgi:hypothetical protein
MRHLIVLVCAIVAAVATSSCGAGAGKSLRPAGPAAAFRNVVYADLAGDEDHVWALVAGRDSDERPLGIRVYERKRQSGWRAMRAVPWTTSGRGVFAIAAWRGRPCVAVPHSDAEAGDSILCSSGGRWKSVLDVSALEDETVGSLDSHRGRLLTTTTRTRQGTGSTTHTIRSWTGETWRQIGDPIEVRSGIAALGRTGRHRMAPDVLVETTGATPPTRSIYGFRDGRWTPVGAPIKHATIGPNVSGPVSRFRTTWVAVNEAGLTPWRFSVWRRDSPSGPWRARTLNTGRGNAQGAVYPGNAGVWAIWVESHPRRSGALPFSERIWAARLDDGDARPVSLHRGPSVGPGDLAVVDGAGATWALYMSTTPSGGMALHIRTLPDDEHP